MMYVSIFCCVASLLANNPSLGSGFIDKITDLFPYPMTELFTFRETTRIQSDRSNWGTPTPRRKTWTSGCSLLDLKLKLGLISTSSLSIEHLRQEIAARGSKCLGCKEKQEFVALLENIWDTPRTNMGVYDTTYASPTPTPTNTNSYSDDTWMGDDETQQTILLCVCCICLVGAMIIILYWWYNGAPQALMAANWDWGQHGRPLFGRHRNESNKQRLNNVLEKIRVLPIEDFQSRSHLQKCGVRELKQKLRDLKVPQKKFATCVEKRELVNLVMEVTSDGIGSTGTSCSICIDDYEQDDVLRVFPCGHKFHLDCADRWAISSQTNGNSSANPNAYKFKCPLCNVPI